MTHQDEILLTAAGWTVECQNPLELRHADGSFASGQAARIVLADVLSECGIVAKSEELQVLEERVEWIGQIAESAKVLSRNGDTNSYWASAYVLVFGKQGAQKISKLLQELDMDGQWDDPAGSYADDVQAYVRAMKEKLQRLQHLLGAQSD